VHRQVPGQLPYDAITAVDTDGRQVAKISAAVCKGCGRVRPSLPGERDRPARIHRGQMRASIDSLAKEPVSMSTTLRDPREIIREEPMMHSPSFGH